jgi:hypothetical protein
MANGFRRIALAQGLLPQGTASDLSPAWTDAALSALLQIDDAPQQIDPPAREQEAPQPRSPDRAAAQMGAAGA